MFRRKRWTKQNNFPRKIGFCVNSSAEKCQIQSCSGKRPEQLYLDYHEHSYAIYGCKISDELRFVRRVLIIQTREHDGKISCIPSVNDKINNSHVQRKLRESINSSLKSVINFIHLFIYELQTSGTKHHDVLV